MDDANEAIRFKDFYINLIENQQRDLPIHLSTNIVLDWFGKTIKTRKMVVSYFREQVGKIAHNFNDDDVKFVEKIGFRPTHRIEITKEDAMIVSSTSSSSSTSTITNEDDHVTPPPSKLEIGQGDGVQNLLMSPCKKMKLLSDNTETITTTTTTTINDECREDLKNLKFITANGRLEFYRRSSKKFQNETKWQRPIKLHIGYQLNNFKDFTIYLIIYEGNLKCRRNLLNDFCENDQKQQQQE